MYVRNIIALKDAMLTGEMLVLNFKSGKTSKILNDDKLEMVSADLQITRIFKSGKRCILFIDPAEVESIILKGEEL